MAGAGGTRKNEGKKEGFMFLLKDLFVLLFPPPVIVALLFGGRK